MRRALAQFRGWLNTPALRRAVTWYLGVAVAAGAVFSGVTGQFEVWVDLRMLGWGGMALAYAWSTVTLLAVLLAAPRLGWRNRTWQVARSSAWGWRLLWPSYVMLVCLVANTTWYYLLFSQGRADDMIPLPGVAAFMLGAWVLLMRRWLREIPAGSKAMPIARWKQGGLGLAGVLTAVLIGGFLLVHDYQRPPPEGAPVDLAVVLGGRLRKDGTASVMLADRVRVATNLYKKGLVRHILLSGGFEPPTVYHTGLRNELAAMRQVCLDEGVPAEAISIDPVGVNTKATAFNARDLMRERDYRSVVCCSTSYHLFRTNLSFSWMGVETYTLASQPAEWRCADPRDTMRELAGIVVYLSNPDYRRPKGELMKLTSPRMLVRKTAGVVELFDGERLVKSYPCITGGNTGDKTKEGDRKTPIGSFRIVFKNPLSKFHLSLGLDYPNREDAQRGLDSGLITRAQYDGILEALASDLSLEANQKKLWYTPLGGEIFIHGHGEGRAGTAGCIALSNPDMDELYAILPVGTPVEIRP